MKLKWTNFYQGRVETRNVLLSEGVDVDDFGQPLDQADVFVHSAKKGQQTRVQSKG